MSNELTVLKPSEIAALDPQSRKVAALIYNIQQSGGVTEADIRRVKNPSGGGLMFEIENASGDPEPVRDLVGIPLIVVPRRQLWGDKKIGSGDRPVCSSTDLIHGVKRRDDKTGAVDISQNILDIAIPGGADGLCAGCPFDEWGTAVKQDGTPGEGKRCQESRVIYFLRVGDILPVKLTIPPSSLGNFRKSLKQLPDKFDQCVVRIYITKGKNGDGQDVGMFNIEPKSTLDDEAVERLNAFRPLFQKVIENATAERTDAGDAERREARAKNRPGRKDEIPADQKF